MELVLRLLLTKYTATKYYWKPYDLTLTSFSRGAEPQIRYFIRYGIVLSVKYMYLETLSNVSMSKLGTSR